MSKLDNDPQQHSSVNPDNAVQKIDLPETALRALAEAAERRKTREKNIVPLPEEINGRDGPDPVRYGDWEKKGIAVDF